MTDADDMFTAELGAAATICDVPDEHMATAGMVAVLTLDEDGERGFRWHLIGDPDPLLVVGMLTTISHAYARAMTDNEES